MKPVITLRLLICGLVSALAAPFAHGGVFLTNVASFSSATGSHPSAGLVLASDGNFYGTTFYGSVSNAGTVFRLPPGGAISALASFGNTNGANSYSALIEHPNGVFYGTTSAGGTNGGGTVFKFTSNNAAALVSFNGTNGFAPQAGLVPGADGNFYGTTSAGGTNGGYGTVFKMTPAGALSTLFSFNNTNGAAPDCALVQIADGSFYGTTSSGGSNGYGTVFRVTTNGGFTNLVQFDNTNGATPYCGLILTADGNLYGATSAGGTNGGYGTVFKMTPAGGFTPLFSFSGTNGTGPFAPLLQGADGNFYGTTELGGTNNDGTIFKITPGGNFTLLASLDYFATGNLPMSALVAGADGNLYGTAHNGGATGQGSIFRLSAPMPPVGLSITPSNGNITCVWSAVAWQTYQEQVISNITLTNWVSLGGPITATNGRVSVSDTPPPGAAQRYYRALVLP